MRTVAIAGVGLIGGSFGLALRKAGFEGRILGVSSPRSISAGRRLGAIDAGVTLEEAASEADLLFLSQPISGILQTLDQLDPLLTGRRIVVTDVGSTKTVIEAKARVHLKDAFFVGGHPMAGKEVRGVEASDPDLFRGRPWIVTSWCGSPVELEFFSYIEKIGANLVKMDAPSHDRAVAWGSHLPQLLSTNLAALLASRAPEAAKVAGPGLIDMTRLALSSYDLWKDIIDTNRDQIAGALEAFARQLRDSRENPEPAFLAGAEFAGQLRASRE